MHRTTLSAAGLALLACLASTQLVAQDTPADSAAPAHAARTPISLGNYPNVNGLRINFRDRALEQVTGVNVTLWFPYEPMTGTARGLSLGLPATGARVVRGIALAPAGVSAGRELRGVALGGIGVGSGGLIRGIAVGGVGVGAGGLMDGIMFGGIGVGSAGSVRGIMIGGVGAATGGAAHGVVIGGIGAGIARDLTGIAFGGVGLGVAGNVKGIVVGGVGTGAGGNITGVALSGIGTAAGGEIRGIGVSGVAVGANSLAGLFVAPVVGATTGRALVIAPAWFRVQPEGTFSGISVSAVNGIRGASRGLNIGIVNYARSMHGVQVGVINIIANAGAHRVLPIFNWGTK